MNYINNLIINKVVDYLKNGNLIVDQINKIYI